MATQGDAQPFKAGAPDGLQSAASRRADGKALRKSVPREKHAGWTAPGDRRDIIEIIAESNVGRMPDLVPIRHGRMLQSPFAFFRGSASIMAADLARTPVSGLRVQACGDAHLMNFGGFASPERTQIFDINDFDETLPAPWEWDIKRLAASVIVAGRDIELPESDSIRAARAAARSYRERMADYSTMRALDVWYDKIDLKRLLRYAPDKKSRERAARRFEEARIRSVPDDDYPKLVEHSGETPQIRDNPPLIFHPVVEMADTSQAAVDEALAQYRASLPDHTRVLYDKFRFVDVAMKVVGVGSVGTVTLVALFAASNDDPLFLQLKQAGPSVLAPYAGASLYSNEGQRIVVGQRLMQSASDIFLGWTTGRLAGRHFYARQLRDMKVSLKLENMDGEILSAYASVCAWALARAHARSGHAAMLSGYMGSSEAFDDAIAEFALEYADQNEEDYTAFVKAVREGRLEATLEDLDFRMPIRI